MTLINCKVELKLKWTKHCILSVVGNASTNEHYENVFGMSGILYCCLLKIIQP